MTSPDYVGSWDCRVCFAELPEDYDPEKPVRDSYFFIHINSSQTTGSTTPFQGRCEDRFGNSKITGHITDTSIEFEKTYDEKAIQNGAAKNPLQCRGARHQKGGLEFFAGLVLNSYVVDAPKVFIMQTFIPPC